MDGRGAVSPLGGARQGSRCARRRWRGAARWGRAARWAAALIATAVFVVPAALAAPASAQEVVDPLLAGSVSDATTLPGVDSVAVAGSYAYVTDYYAGRLSAIDLSLPSAPFIAGSSASSSELMNGSTVNVAGGYAFVVSKNRNGPKGSGINDNGTGNSLTILDIHTNPAEPQIVGAVHDSNSLFGAYGIAVSGNYAYVAAQGCVTGHEQPCPNHSVGCDLDVIEIAGSGAPKIVATLRSSSEPQAFGHVTSVAISGHYAYLTAAYQSRLTVVDIANPLSPKLVASLDDPTHFKFPVDVAISGSYAYVIDQEPEGPLVAVDISNPKEPKVVGSLSTPALSGGYRIRIRGEMAYVAASEREGIAVADISNPSSPRLLASYVDSAHLHTTTGLDLDSTGKYLVATSPYLSTQHQPYYPPYALEPEGPELEGTVSVITLDPEPIEARIESGPASSTTQTSASLAFSVDDAVATVQCQLDSGPWTLCTTPTSQSYASLSPGPHRFQVQATDSAGVTDTAAYSWTITAPPANTTPPSIAGSVAQGQVLTASPGSWSGYPAPSFAYRWERCDEAGQGCAGIAGATSSTYTTTSADVGSTLVVVVTASNESGSRAAESAPTAAVTAPPSDKVPPSISGTVAAGQMLTASPGSWSGYPAPTFAYQWERCDESGQGCVAIGGATSSTYTTSSANVGSTLVVLVTASNSVGQAQASSVASAIVSGPPVNVSLPSISGTAAAGHTLLAASGSWSAYPAPSFAYRWERCDEAGQGCAGIAGATSSTYTTTSADVGSTLVVVVTASNESGSRAAESAPTAAVTAPPSDKSPPVVLGTASVGQTLSATAGSWSGYPTPAYSLQWERCNEAGEGCVAIAGATASTYTAVSADVGSTLGVLVTASNEVGQAHVRSAATAVVTAPGGGGSSGGSGGGSGAGNPGGAGTGSGGVLGSHESAPSTAQIESALLSALLPHGKACRLDWVRKRHGCQVTFFAPAAGEVVISWYLPPKGAHLAGAKPVLVASGRATVATKGEVKLKLRLTARGRSLLTHGRQLKLTLTGRGAFTLVGGSPVTVVKSFALR